MTRLIFFFVSLLLFICSAAYTNDSDKCDKTDETKNQLVINLSGSKNITMPKQPGWYEIVLVNALPGIQYDPHVLIENRKYNPLPKTAPGPWSESTPSAAAEALRAKADCKKESIIKTELKKEITDFFKDKDAESKFETQLEEIKKSVKGKFVNDPNAPFDPINEISCNQLVDAIVESYTLNNIEFCYDPMLLKKRQVATVTISRESEKKGEPVV